MEALIAEYNAQEKVRFSPGVDRTVDAMRRINQGGQEVALLEMNPNLFYFWVHVVHQSEEATAAIRRQPCGMPEGFNNIAIYWPGQRIWGLKWKTTF